MANAIRDLDDVKLVIAGTGPCNKILEPMSCSLPVFTTPQGMIGLYNIEHEKSIFVFQDSELPERVNELIFDHQQMKRVGDEARRVVEEYHSRRVNEHKIVQVVENVIRGQ